MEQPDPKHYNDFLQDAIQILDTLVLSIELPPEIVAAINRQTEQYYMIKEYKFRVQREAEESKRKQIEADGIAAFQKTVSQGISDSYLRWRGIEATLALAQSPNTKIVIIGSGKDGLPIILGNDVPAAGCRRKPPASTACRAAGAPARRAGATPPISAAPAEPANPASQAAIRHIGRGRRRRMPTRPRPPTPPTSPPSGEGRQATTAPLTLSDVQALLSRISGGLVPPAPATSRQVAASQPLNRP